MTIDISPALSRELTMHLFVKKRLMEEFPDTDEETLADTLEGLSNLQDMLAAILRSRAEDEGLCLALKQRLDDMRARYQRLQERAEKKRDLVCEVMEQAALHRLTTPDLSVSLRKTPAPVEIIDENAIPQEFWKSQAPKLDRASLSESLRLGREITGARLGEPRMTISIRTR